MTTDPNALRLGLNSFYNGTNNVYRHGLNRAVSYSDGVRYFAQNAGHGAYWLLDILATQPQILCEVRANGFAFIKFKVEEGGRATLTVTDGGKGGEPEQVVYRRDIDWTDCPPGLWEFNYENMMVMLPSER
jgi:hypothetical protein